MWVLRSIDRIKFHAKVARQSLVDSFLETYTDPNFFSHPSHLLTSYTVKSRGGGGGAGGREK